MTKDILTILLLFLTVLPAFPEKPALPDPSAAYAHFLGYKYETRKNPDGAEYGVCIFPDGSECHAWDFFRGICGKNYSYCALKGCETGSIRENRGSGYIHYAVCSCTDSSGYKKVTPLMEFMEQHGDTLIDYNPDEKGGNRK